MPEPATILAAACNVAWPEVVAFGFIIAGILTMFWMSTR